MANLRRKLGDMARRLGLKPSETVKVVFEGKNIVLDAASGSDLVARQFAANAYEHPLPALVSASLRCRPGVFLDVGANNGIYSIIAAQADSRVRVQAFEPYPPVLKILRENIRLNGLRRQVDIVPLALGAESALVTLHIPSDAHGLLETSCSLEADFQPTAATVEVQVRRLDDLIGSTVPTVIKADIEGHEPHFMEGARRTIETHRPILFYEMLGNAPHREQLVGQFKQDVDYLDYRLRPDLVILSDDVIFDGLAWNHALIPREREQEFRGIVESIGLTVDRQSGA